MKHVASLRLSLLVSLGLVPVACGGNAFQKGDGDSSTSGAGRGGTASSGGPGHGGGKPTSAGTSGKGGAPNVAGTSAVGGALSVGGKTGVAGTTAVGGTDAGGASPGPVCTSPKLDPATGLVTCDEGYRHRQTVKECVVSEDAAGGAPADTLPRASGLVSCTGQPGECTEFFLGYCGVTGQVQSCLSGCVNDNNCGTGEICVCGAPSPTGGVCVPSPCKSDADCGSSSFCASYDGLCGGTGFACLEPEDECVTSADCGFGTCWWDSSKGHRACNGAVCGRPFLVEAETRVAPLVMNGDWSRLEGATPRLDHLTRAERAVLAEHWTRMGQMEHASIAAFARFSLQLLALGAPPDLVEACTRALADETAHTQLCFRLASAYAGKAIGPGALDISGQLLPTSLGEIVELVIAEGCFGETSAALEALQAAEAASDPVIVAAYQRIATDEQRHAELAFRFVRWALERGESDVADRIASAITTPPSRDSSALGVALPCLRALLAAA